VLYRREFNRDPQVGDESWPGQVLIEIIDLAALQARLYVLERDAGSLAKGDEVTVRLDSNPEKTYHGVVRSVSALAQPLERNSPLNTSPARSIRDAGADMRRIKPGMSIKADVILENYDACLSCPPARSRPRTPCPRSTSNRAKFTARQVTVGSAAHGQATILEGVKDSELLAMRNPFEVRRPTCPTSARPRQAAGGPAVRAARGRHAHHDPLAVTRKTRTASIRRSGFRNLDGAGQTGRHEARSA